MTSAPLPPLRPGRAADARRTGVRRATWQSVLSLVVALALVVPMTALPEASAQSQEDQLDQIEGQIDQAEAEIGSIDAEVEVSLDELNRILADLEILQTELNQRDAELRLAQAELENREAILVATTAALELAVQRVATTRDNLDIQRSAYEARVRQSYITARPDQTMPVFSATDIAQFTQASRYVEAIVERDRAGYEQIDVLRRQIEAGEAELERLRAQQADEQAAAADERDRVAVLVAEQQALVAQVEARAGDKQQVLEGLEADRGTAEALIAQLEAESAQIEAELRAAAAAAAAQAAAAAAAQAAAAAAAGSSSSSGSSGGSSSSGSATSVPVTGSGRFGYPINGRVSSNFGYRRHPISGVTRLHAGIDLAAGNGTPIGAAGPGTVIYAGWRGGYGNTVMIDHGGGIVTLYAHQSRIAASNGQQVSRGQVIGYVGSTGASTGNHLHWEVRVNGSPRDPRGYV